MNTQDILRRGGVWLDATLDFSEYYDYELVSEIPNNVPWEIDIVLDYSEFYDYTLGDTVIDYIYYETVEPICVFHFLLTEDGCVMDTENNCSLEYEFNGEVQ